MSKIIKVSTDLEVTVHDFPQGNMELRLVSSAGGVINTKHLEKTV